MSFFFFEILIELVVKFWIETNNDPGLNISFFRFNMVLDLLVAKNGIVDIKVVIDMQGWSFSHLTKVNITAMKKFLHYLQVKSQNTIKRELSAFFCY